MDLFIVCSLYLLVVTRFGSELDTATLANLSAARLTSSCTVASVKALLFGLSTTSSVSSCMGPLVVDRPARLLVVELLLLLLVVDEMIVKLTS